MTHIKVKDTGLVYRNPVPHICSKQAYFPSIVEFANGELLVTMDNLVPLEGNRLLTIHAQREDQVGLYVRIIEILDNKFQILAEKNIWDNAASVTITSYLDMSNSLKFGQPSLTQLNKDEFLATHWAILDGHGKILTHSLAIEGS